MSREGSRDVVASSAKTSKSSFGVCGRSLGLTPRAQPPIPPLLPSPPPTIARPSQSSATLGDVESMMLSIAAQVSICGSMVRPAL
jgi:hypothetical protein